MTETQDILPAETVGIEITRFNALKYGVLSCYTVLPWEDADEYRVPASSLADEHRPQGPTEEHLVEDLAGILWRSTALKRRLDSGKQIERASCRGRRAISTDIP